MSIVTQSIGVYQSWTPTFTGFSADPSAPVCRYTLNGKMCTVSIITGNGTSNATTFTMTLPFASKTTFISRAPALGVDAGTSQNSYVSTRSNSNIMDVYRIVTTNTWTASGNKAITVQFTYEIE